MWKSVCLDWVSDHVMDRLSLLPFKGGGVMLPSPRYGSRLVNPIRHLPSGWTFRDLVQINHYELL